MPPWLTRLIDKLQRHIHDVDHQDWLWTPMDRGVYFYQLAAAQLPHHNYRAYHLFINNYEPSIHIFHCAAKLEANAPPIRPEIEALFQGDGVQEGAAGGGREIGWAEIVHPRDFNVGNPDDVLPEELWINIQARFLLRPVIRNFIQQCAL